MNPHGRIVAVKPGHTEGGAPFAAATFGSGAILLGCYNREWDCFVCTDANPEARSGMTLLAAWKPTDGRAPNAGDIIDAFLSAESSGQLETAALLLLGTPPTA